MRRALRAHDNTIGLLYGWLCAARDKAPSAAAETRVNWASYELIAAARRRQAILAERI